MSTCKNRRLAELLGISPKKIPGIGREIDVYPDFASDPRLVLREMMKRKDWPIFAKTLKYSIGDREYHGDTQTVGIIYILDTTGRLRDAAIKFLEERDGSKS